MADANLTPTDRELLELAAKAAGVELSWRPIVLDLTDREWPAVSVDDGRDSWTEWNPLTDDGDALRLAISTGTCIEFGYCLDDAPIVRCGHIHERDTWPQVGNFPDPGAATRRAIVLAAAEIGGQKR